MRHNHSIKSHPHALYTICIIGLIYGLHISLPSYINSTFLKQYTTENIVSYIYVIGSLATIFGLYISTRLLKKFGNYALSSFLITLEFIMLYFMLTAKSIVPVAIFFTIATISASIISFCIDIYIESYSDNKNAGRIRGLYLTVFNTAWVFAPLIAGALASSEGYKRIYLASMGLLVPFLYLIQKNLHSFKDPEYHSIKIIPTLKKIGQDRDIRSTFIANTVLNIFYAWMVVYTPIYLHDKIGLGWDSLGIIFTIMLLPFIFLDLPLGKLADKKWGEKEMLIIGLLIMGISTISLAFIKDGSILLWSLGLFATRIGAATSEIMLETYFFKKIKSEDSNIIGMFRVSRPFSYLIAPFITIIGILCLPYNMLFVVLGIICLLPIFSIAKIKDTK